MTDPGPRGRRGVLDDARRRVERALMLTDAAAVLADAAERTVAAVDAGTATPGSAEVGALRDAIARYRRLDASRRAGEPGGDG